MRVIDNEESNVYDDIAGRYLRTMGREPENHTQEGIRNSKLRRIKSSREDRVETLNWIVEDSYQYLEGRMSYGSDSLIHSRAILFLRPECLILVDRIKSVFHTYCRKYLHMPPDISVGSARGRKKYLQSGDFRHCIYLPLSFRQDTVWEIITGETEPEYQGWYSGSINNFEEAPVLQESFFVKAGEEIYSVTLLLPTGRSSPSTYRIEQSNTGSWNPERDGELRIEYTGTRFRTKLSYMPSSAFMTDSIDIRTDSASVIENASGQPPLIRIKKTRFR
jgi:hypothetical protein